MAHNYNPSHEQSHDHDLSSDKEILSHYCPSSLELVTNESTHNFNDSNIDRQNVPEIHVKTSIRLSQASTLSVQPASTLDPTSSQHSTTVPILEQDIAPSTLNKGDIYCRTSDSSALSCFDASVSDSSPLRKGKGPAPYINPLFFSSNVIVLKKQETTISSLVTQYSPSQSNLYSISDPTLRFSDKNIPIPSGLKEPLWREKTSSNIEAFPTHEELIQEQDSTTTASFSFPVKGNNVAASSVQKELNDICSDSSPKTTSPQSFKIQQEELDLDWDANLFYNHVISSWLSKGSLNPSSAVILGSTTASQSVNVTTSHRNSGQLSATNPSDTFMVQETTKECIICADTVSTYHFIAVTPYCQHENNVCKQCVTKHIEHEVRDNGNIRIICPGDERCREDLEEADVRRFIRDETVQRYLALSIRATVTQMPEFRWCANPYCDSGQLHADGVAAPIMTCFECSQRSCVIHGVPLSIGAQCSHCDSTSQRTTLNQEPRPSGVKSKFNLIARWKTAKRIRREKRLAKITQGKNDAYDVIAPKISVEEEIQNNNWISSRTKGCPKCNVRIEKYKGCDHMTCRSVGCGHEFCWECLADYGEIRTKGKRYHKESCKYYD